MWIVSVAGCAPPPGDSGSRKRRRSPPLDAMRAELAVTVDPDEGYGLPLADAATLAGLDPERAERMIRAHHGQVRAARAAVDADAALARWTLPAGRDGPIPGADNRQETIVLTDGQHDDVPGCPPAGHHE